MAEEVSTGGLHSFRYGKGNEPRLSDDKKKELREAYARADERKARERRNRIIFWIIGGLIVLASVGYLILK
jgi:hypothetical protein